MFAEAGGNPLSFPRVFGGRNPQAFMQTALKFHMKKPENARTWKKETHLYKPPFFGVPCYTPED